MPPHNRGRRYRCITMAIGVLPDSCFLSHLHLNSTTPLAAHLAVQAPRGCVHEGVQIRRGQAHRARCVTNLDFIGHVFALVFLFRQAFLSTAVPVPPHIDSC